MDPDQAHPFSIRSNLMHISPFYLKKHKLGLSKGSVSDPYSLNPDPDPDPANNLNPDPSYFLTLSDDNIKIISYLIIRFSHQKKSIKRYYDVKSKFIL